MKLQLGEGVVVPHIDTSTIATIGSDIMEETYWNPEGDYDEGWERAGGESFMRKGWRSRSSFESGEEPLIIEKSGNPNKTVNRGKTLEAAGGILVPTLMFIEEGVDPSEQRLYGGQYQIFQKFIPGNFGESYERGSTGPQAIEDFARNCAAIDVMGFRPGEPSRQVDEFLSDGEGCYIVDFGGDIMGQRYEPSERMYNMAISYLRDSDISIFEEAYENAREEVPQGYSPHVV